MSARGRKRNAMKAKMALARSKIPKATTEDVDGNASAPILPADKPVAPIMPTDKLVAENPVDTSSDYEADPEETFLDENEVFDIAKSWIQDPDRSRETVQMVSTLLFCYHRSVRLRATVAQAAKSVSEAVGKGEKTIRGWVSELKTNDGEFLEYGRGKYARLLFMSDELCRSMAAKWVREHSCAKGARNMTVKDFMQYVNETMLQAANFPENFPKKIGLTTARKFLHDLGFSRTDTSERGVYKDGHERPDVVSYRKVYVQRLQTLEKNHSAPPLPSDVVGAEQPCLLWDLTAPKQLVTMYHDESTFQANDDQKYAWAQPDQSFLKKKCRGSGIMISDFIEEFGGFLGFTDEEYIEFKSQHPESVLPQTARISLEYGCNRDGYWRSDAFFDQLKVAVAIAEAKYPKDRFDIVFIFDHSSNHAAFSPDALVASRMRVGAGLKQPVMRDTSWNGELQKMVFEDGRPKGLRAVLYKKEALILLAC